MNRSKLNFLLICTSLCFSGIVSLQAEAQRDFLGPVSEYERVAFLTPGGKYTENDIQANGHLTPAQKFKGFKASHNAQPKSGDTICPITLTKANPNCSWVVNGKTYQFCCPMCIDEFLQIAKEHPDELQDPEAYVKE